MNKPYIDHSVFPDRDEFSELKSDFFSDLERAEYVERICGAWDFDVRPEPETLTLFRNWKTIFDQFPLLHSPGYHAFRTFFGWNQLPRVGGTFIVPAYQKLDRAEGHGQDPCERMI